MAAAIAVCVLVLSACSGATETPEPATQAPTSAPVTAAPSAEAPTEAPSEAPTDDEDGDLAAACDALEEFRAAGNLVEMTGNALDGEYSEFETASLALLDQMNSFVEASRDIDPEGPYADWKKEALLISIAISNAIVQWDTGVSQNDAAALMAGNEAMQEATDGLPAFNAAAAEWEGDCP